MPLINKERFTVFILSFLATSTVLANPVLGSIASGKIAITQTPNVTTITQSSPQAIINWQSFNIGAQQATHFFQPPGGIALNRISPEDGASEIYGELTATGEIILINPAGIYFGPNSYVNVGGLIATTSNITDQNFLNGNYIFNQPSTYANPSIINEGSIIAADHGLIALVGQNVTNNGLIQADLGHVILASGDAYIINFAGDNMVNFAFNNKPSPQSDSVTNNGSLIADGGHILVTAQQTSNVLDNAINLNGVVQARSVYKQGNGDIVISGSPNGGVVNVAANINASGKRKHQTGGTVNISGYDILLNPSTSIDVSGDAGGGTINIGGDAHGLGVLPNANAVVMEPGATLNASAITSGNGGNIVVWSNNYTNALGNILAMGGSESGNGGNVETSSAGILNVNGISVNTSAPNGSFGTWLLDPSDIYIALNQADATAAGMVTTDTSANSSGPTTFAASGAVQDSLLTTATLDAALGNNNVTVTTTNASGTGVGNITVVDPISWTSAYNLTLTATKNIVLDSTITNTGGANVNLIADNTGTGVGAVCGNGGSLCGGTPTGTVTLSGGSGVVSVFYNPTAFGTPDTTYSGGTTPINYELIDELGAATDTTTRSLASVSNQSGLWDQNFALAENIPAAATSGWNSGAGFSPIGNGSTKFTGAFNGQDYTISNLFINRPGTNYVGLIGFSNTTGPVISDLSLANANITGYSFVGALIGYASNGTIVADNAGSISVTGSVSGFDKVGSLVGDGATIIISPTAQGDITSSATVTGVNAFEYIGGLVGECFECTLSNLSYTGSSVSAPNAYSVGGLVGYMDFGTTLTNSYSTADVSAMTNVGGLVGIIGNFGTNSIVSTGPGLTYASGNVSGTGSSIGGLVGANAGTISPAAVGDVTFTGTVTGTGPAGSTGVGGLIGANDTNAAGGTLSNLSYTSNPVSAPNYTDVGGLVGENGGTITNSSATVNVTGNTDVGGLIGANDNALSLTGTQSLSYSVGTVSGAGTGIGGAIGLNNDAITLTGTATLSSSGAVMGTGSEIGGLIGDNENTLSVSGSALISSTSNVTGTGTASDIGGLIGLNDGTITPTAQGYLTATGTVTGSENVGGIIGYNDSNGNISNLSYTSADIVSSPSAGGDTGGVVGFNIGTITDSYATVNVTGFSNIGGLVGYNGSSGIIASNGTGLTYSTGNVSASSNAAGSLAGRNDGTITPAAQGDITATGSVTTTVNGTNSIGGLIGYNQGSLSNLSYTSSALNVHNLDVGGLVGQNAAGGVITNSYATIDVTNGGTDTGGLVGENSGTIQSTGVGQTYYSTGTVQGVSNVGGFIGENDGSVLSAGADQVYSNANVSGSGNNIGGLVGYNNSGTISPLAVGDVISTGTVTGTGAAGSTALGGLVGNNEGVLSNLYNTVTVSNTNYNDVGGIAGLSGTNDDAHIYNTYNTANITGGTSVGGLVGYEDSPGATLSASYNTGTITGEGSVGGIVGTLDYSNVTDVYNTGNVFNVATQTNPTAFGGVVGNANYAYGYIENAYNSGYVNADEGGQSGTDVGGVIGSASLGGTTIGFLYNTGYVVGASNTGGLFGTVTDSNGLIYAGTSYWNTDTSGQTVGANNLSSNNLIGANTAAMGMQTTYTDTSSNPLNDWDFGSTWGIIDGSSYPYLQFFYPSAAGLSAITSTSTSDNAGVEVELAANGTVIDQSYTGANGASYFLEGINNLSGLGNTITPNDPLFLYFSGGPTESNAIAYAPASGLMGFGNGFTLASNTVTVGLGTTAESFTNANINTIVNGNGNALFSLSGNDLILNSDISFATTSPTTYSYSATGNLTTSGTATVNIAGSLAGSGNPITITTNGSSSIGGVISNFSSFTKDGTGTLTLSGDNTYSGNTIVNAGVLSITNPDALGTTGAITVNGGSLSLNLGGSTLADSAAMTLNGAGAGGIGALYEAGTSGTDTVQNPIILGSATTIGANTGSTLDLNGNINNGANLLTFTGGGNFNESGIIGNGSGGVTMAGTGTLTLSGNNTYTGITTLNDGTLVAAVSGALGNASGGAIDITPTAAATAILDLTALSDPSGLTNPNTINFDSSSGGTAQMNTNDTLTLSNPMSLTGTGNQFDVSANNTTLNGDITGSGGLTVLGGGTLTLGGSNSYGGTTTIDAGTVVAANATALSNTDTIVNSGAQLTISGVTIGNDITLNDATLNGVGPAGLNGTITLGTGTSDVIDAKSGNFSLGGAIDGTTAGDATLTLQGAGNLTLGADIGDTFSLLDLTANTPLNLSNSVALSATTLAINDGVNGVGENLALNGTNMSVIGVGTVTLDNLSFTGTGANNSSTLDTGGTQSWDVTGSDSGNVSDSNITNPATFSNVQNLNGGSGTNDFTLSAGGSLSGNISGGSGVNTLTGGSAPMTWNITGTNQVTATGVSGSLNNIENLVGGTSGNVYIFADNAKLTGTISGGSLSNTNTLNYLAYSTPINITVSNSQYNGSVTNSSNQVITSYTNINNLVGNSSNTNVLDLRSLPPLTPGQLVINGLSGSLADPLTWMGFEVDPPATLSGQSLNIFAPDVSQIIQQPDENGNTTGSDWLSTTTTIDQNVDDIQSQEDALFEKYLSNLKINPYCSG